MEQLKQIIAEWSVKPDDVKKPYILSAQILNEDNPEKLEFNLILSSDHLVNHLLKTGERKVIGKATWPGKGFAAFLNGFANKSDRKSRVSWKEFRCTPKVAWKQK